MAPHPSFIRPITGAVNAASAPAENVPVNYQSPLTGYGYAYSVLDNSGCDYNVTDASGLTTMLAFSDDAGDYPRYDAVEITGGYYVWVFVGGYANGGGSEVIGVVREGADTSTDTTVAGGSPGTGIQALAPGMHVLDNAPGDTVYNIATTFMKSSNPSGGREAEWGIFLSNAVANAVQMFHGTLIVLPAENATGTLGHEAAGTPNIGRRNNSWFSHGWAGSHTFDPGGDTDLSYAPTTQPTIVHGNEDYLVFFNAATSGGNATQVWLRVIFTVDGEDFVGVRSNTKTSGATRTGRGFGFGRFTSGAQGHRQNLAAFRVMNLSAGAHTIGATINQHETADATHDGHEFVINGIGQCQLFRTSMFSQFTYDEYDQAIFVNSDTAQTAPWSVTITADGTTPIVIGFCTTVHVGEQAMPDLILKRDSTSITRDSAGSLGHVTTRAFTPDWSDLSDGAADSDNYTLPITLTWVDTPSAGEHTYTIQYRRNSSIATGGGDSLSSYINCRDDGSSGFVGTLFAFEFKFATQNLGY